MKISIKDRKMAKLEDHLLLHLEVLDNTLQTTKRTDPSVADLCWDVAHAFGGYRPLKKEGLSTSPTRLKRNQLVVSKRANDLIRRYNQIKVYHS